MKKTATLIGSIGWSATALVVGCLLCSGIMADSRGECYERHSYNASRSIPYEERYSEKCWKFWTLCNRTRIKYKNETYEAFRLNKTKCRRYEDESRDYQPRYSEGYRNCQKPRICDCNAISTECDSICEPRAKSGGFIYYCGEGYEFSDDRTKCLPKCSPSCAANAWCQQPNNCACKPGYVGNGTSCLPVCKQGCANGICEDPYTCRCDDYWSGSSCDEPLACVVASLASDSYSIDTLASNLSFTMDTDDEVEYSKIARTAPACDQKCPDEILMHAFGSITSRSNVTYYLIPTGVTCNNTEYKELFFARHDKVIVRVMLAGIAFLIVGIICIVWVLRGREKSNNKSTDNIVQYTSNGYIEENPLYEATKNTVDH
ncbi:uncharacterized protein [Neodiprion pinetum]|uniref:uncharacterized protein n=1 Tax=Neodiprion pinetum TaxID=441929 RepID=UPI001EE12A10|nr:uncharacterized protein LOC124216592 [Neodiprion pinetum]